MRLVPVAGVCWIYKKASMSRSSKPAGGHSLDSQTEQLQQIIDRTFALSHTLQRVLIEVRRVAVSARLNLVTDATHRFYWLSSGARVISAKFGTGLSA